MGAPHRSRWLVVGAIALAAAPVAADDGATQSLSVSESPRIGPLFQDLAFERVDAAVGKTWWRRLHVAVDGSLGYGGQTALFEQLELEAGMWLHASDRVELLTAWRAGYTHFSLFGMGLGAKIVEAIPVEIRLHVRGDFDVRFAPAVMTNYFTNLWSVMVGPEIGVVWRM